MIVFLGWRIFWHNLCCIGISIFFIRLQEVNDYNIIWSFVIRLNLYSGNECCLTYRLIGWALNLVKCKYKHLPRLWLYEWSYMKEIMCKFWKQNCLAQSNILKRHYIKCSDMNEWIFTSQFILLLPGCRGKCKHLSPRQCTTFALQNCTRNDC